MAIISNTLPVGYTVTEYQPIFDPIGNGISNLIPGEVFVISSGLLSEHSTVIPSYAPFYLEGAVLEKKNTDETWTPLLVGVDFYYSYPFLGAQRATAKEIAGGFTFTDPLFSGEIRFNYQTLGGEWVTGTELNQKIQEVSLGNPGQEYIAAYRGRPQDGIAWEQVANYSSSFPEITGPWDRVDLISSQDALSSILELRNLVVDKAIELKQSIDSSHLANYNNPHNLTKAQVGLDQVRDLSSATNAQALNPAENNKYINAAQVHSMILRETPAATVETPGIMRLNSGQLRSDDIDTVKGLTAEGFREQMVMRGSAISSAFFRGQIEVPVLPFPFVYPITWNNQAYATQEAFIAAVEEYSQIDPLEYSSSRGVFWFPPGSRAPDLNIVSS